MILWLFSSIHHNIYINEQRCGITYKPAILKSVKTESNIYCIISCIYKSLYALHPNGYQQTPSHHTSIGFLFATLKGDIAPRCPSAPLSFACRAPPPRAPQLLLSLRVLIIGICLLPWWTESGGGGYDGGIPDGVRLEAMRKTIRFWQKHSLTRDFYGSTPPPTPPPPDMHVHLNIVIKIP